MTGKSRRSTRSRRTDGSRSRSAATILGIAALVALFGLSPSVLGQSGRNRTRPPETPQPQPQPQPPTPSSGKPAPPEPAKPAPRSVPPGGIVAGQTNAGPAGRYALKNGLVLVVRESPATSLVAIRLAARGAADLAAARAAARAERPDGSVSARLRALGASLDVATDGDRATFATVLPAASAEAALAAIAPLLDGGLRPEGATLVVVGNVIPYNVLGVVQRDFGVTSMPAAPPPAPPVPGARPAPAADASYVTTRGDSGLALVRVVFAGPPAKSADAPALDVAASALASGDGSRLGRVLRMSGLAVSVEVRQEWTAEGGDVALEVACDPARLDAVEGAIFREADRLRRERVSDGDLQRARNVFELDFRDRFATVEGEARELERFEARFGEVGAPAKYLAGARAATAADVRRVAAQYFSSAAARVTETLPPDAPARTFTPKTFADTVSAWAPTSAAPVAPGDVRDAEGPAAVPEGRERHPDTETSDAVVLPVPLGVRDFSTLNGPKAFVREDQSRSLVSIGFFYPAGRAAETAGDRGITRLMLRSMLRGSRKYGGDKLVATLDQFGARARVVVEPDFFGFVVECLSRNAELVFPVAIDLVEHPSFDKEAVARERDLLLAEQRLARADAPARSVDLFWQSRYPSAAYGAPALGLPDAVAKLDETRLRDWYASTIATTYPLVAIVGDTDGSSLVSRFVAEGFSRGEGTPAPTPGLPAPAPAGDASEARERTGTAQTIGYPAPGGMGALLDALDVAVAAATAGAAAELDDRLGIARVAGRFERRRLAGAARVTVVSSAGDETRARDVVVAQFAAVGGAALSDAALDAARAAAATSALGDRETFTSLLVEYVRCSALGAPLETAETPLERSRAVTADAVRRAAAAFNPQIAGRGVVRGR